MSIRYEVITEHKSFAGIEPTVTEARSYVKDLVDAGVVIYKVRYYDNDERLNDIRYGFGHRRSAPFDIDNLMTTEIL
jgi:hypothetical protein